MEPLVSIIIPAYNAALYIDEAIGSVVRQSFTGWELIVVNDGSVDDTADKVEAWVASDSRIRQVHQENGGLGAARNTGIAIARSGLIAFLDADDIWLPQKLQSQLALMQATGADLVFADAELLVANTQPITTLGAPAGWFEGAQGFARFMMGNHIPVLTVLVRREALNTVHGFSTDRQIQSACDYHLWLRLLMAGCRMYGSGTVEAKYRVHSGSMSDADRTCLQETCLLLEDLYRKHPAYRELMRNMLAHRTGQWLQTTETPPKDLYRHMLWLHFEARGRSRPWWWRGPWGAFLSVGQSQRIYARHYA
jgi:glycosyltransferase involved in cell wall biosynthesis